MGAGVEDFVQLMNDQEGVYANLRLSLVALADAGRNRESDRITRTTTELLRLRDRAHELEDRMTKMVSEAALGLGVPQDSFKLSLLDPEGRYRTQVDRLRGLVSEVARLSATAGGILSANVNVIEETVKVLESIDARSVGYGASNTAPRPSKMIDRSA